MKSFRWSGIDSLGKSKRGTLRAPSPALLEQQLLKQGIAPLSIEELSSNKQRLSAHLPTLTLHYAQKITPSDICAFCASLAELLDAGIDLMSALSILGRYNENKSLAQAIFRLEAGVKEGQPLWQSMQKEEAFTSLTVQLVRTGEQTGALSEILKRIACHLQREELFKQKLKAAATMPLVSASVSLALLLAIFICIIPRFEAFFLELGKELPPLSKVIFGVSSFLCSNNSLFMLLALLAGIIALRTRLIKSQLAGVKDAIIFKCAPLRSLFFTRELIGMLEALNTLIRAGVPLDEALDLASSIPTSRSLKTSATQIAALVKQGMPLSAAFSQTPKHTFPIHLQAFTALGEQSGSLPKMLSRSIALLSTTLDQKLALVTKLFGPVLIIIVGGVIAIAIIAVYLPIFMLAGNIG